MKHARKQRRYFGAMALVLVVACSDPPEHTGGDDDTATGGTSGTSGTGGSAGTNSMGTLDCVGYCDQRARCASISPEGCLSSCGWSEQENLTLGCTPEYQAVLDCFASSSCDFTEGTCSAEMQGYALCASRSASSLCSTICEREFLCGNTDLGCLVMCGKDARLFADLGCTPEHDAYLTCAMSHADPCEITGAGCAAEDEAALRCGLRSDP